MRRVPDTYVSDIDDLGRFRPCGGVVRKGVRGGRGGVTGVVSAGTAGAAGAAAHTCSISTPSAKAAAEATAATTEPPTAAEATAEAAATAESAAATEAAAAALVGESILADLKGPTLPFKAVELLDGVACVIRMFEHHDSRSLGPSVVACMDVGSEHGPVSGWNGLYQYTCTVVYNSTRYVLPAWRKRSFRSCQPAV